MAGTSERPKDGVDALARWDELRGAAKGPRPVGTENQTPELQLKHGRMRRDRDGQQVYEFEQPRGGRIVLGVLFLMSAAVAVPATIVASRDTTGYNVGIALSLVAFALIFWWAMIGGDRQTIRVVGGVVEVTRGDWMRRFDLRDPTQGVHPFGVPTSRRWRVAFEQPPEGPFVVTRRDVDPIAFSKVLERYRGGMFTR